MPSHGPLPFADTPPPRLLTHEQARDEDRRYWSGKTVAERLAAAEELTRQLLRMRGIDPDEPRKALRARLVRRGER